MTDEKIQMLANKRYRKGSEIKFCLDYYFTRCIEKKSCNHVGNGTQPEKDY